MRRQRGVIKKFEKDLTHKEYKLIKPQAPVVGKDKKADPTTHTKTVETSFYKPETFTADP